jgi:prepilin peptidase CpaA
VTAQVWIAGIVGVAAIVDDVARRKIANWIPCSAFAAGLILQTVQGGWRGAGAALAGTAAGAGVFLIFYLMGGMGGGDVKLMAGFGAVLGVRRLLEAALWTAGCGGLLAALVIVAGYVRQMWRSRSSAKGEASPGGGESRLKLKAESIPYAPAIAAGVWLSLVPKT